MAGRIRGEIVGARFVKRMARAEGAPEEGVHLQGRIKASS